jgi:hypothetical protein
MLRQSQVQSSDPSVNPSPWIRSATWDGIWILSGFWVASLFLLLPLNRAQPLILIFTLFFWISHRFSSLYLALCVREYQPVLQSKKGYFLVFPLCLGLALLAFLLCPESILPLSLFNRFLLLGSIDYFFSLYHFSVQHYGLLSVYRGKLPHGQKDPSLLKWDWWVCIAVSGIFSIILDLLYGEWALLFGHSKAFTPQFSDVTIFGIKAALTGCLVLIWGFTLRVYLQKKQGLARCLYFSSLCYLTLISFYVAPLVYFAMVQIQHWLVALGLSTHMAGNSLAESPQSRWYKIWTWVNQQRWAPLVVLISLSLFLTPFLEADLYIANHFDSANLSMPYLLQELTASGWIFGLGGLALFSSFLHYIYDRGVFRFSDPFTRKAALTLLNSESAANKNQN